MLSASKKLADSQPHLHRVDPGIRRGQSGVRDVHVAQLEADVMPGAKDVHAERGLVHEIHRVRSGGNAVVGEDRATGEFKIRREAPATLKVPLQAERIEAHSIRRVRGLENQEDRNGVDRIFEASAEKAGKMWAGKDPSVTQASVEGAGAAATAGDGVSAASPNLNFMTALFRPGLRRALVRGDQ